MNIDLKIGDLVSEFDPDIPNKNFGLGIVVPFPPSFLENVYEYILPSWNW